MGCLSSLQKLHLKHCTKLVELPSSICNLFQLQEMVSDNCNNLECLSKDLKKLTKLSRFYTSCVKLEWWEPDQSSILRKFKDIGCRMHLLYIQRDTNDLIQLIDDGARRNKIIQFVKKTQSRKLSPSTSYDEESFLWLGKL